MEENRVEDVIEEIEAVETPEVPVVTKKRNRNFWKGVICGAALMLVVSLIVGGTLMIFALKDKNSGGADVENNSSDLISDETLVKLEQIRMLI